MTEAAVGCELRFELQVDTVLALQIAVAEPGDECLTSSGEVEELPTSGRGRVHVVTAPAGALTIAYTATARTMVAEPVTIALDEDALVFRRQSRYCPSDALEGFAASTFGDDVTPADVAAWVHEHLVYEPGSSGPGDGAVDTLLSARGVCRDYAHLTVTLCRAMGYPARVTAVYAPGLDPMDFHAVAEVRTADAWEIHDATRLVPIESLVRICSGRDAADIAFASTVTGDAVLLSATVTAAV